MLGAILFVLRTGIPWRDLPERYGPWPSVYACYRRWCASGLFARMHAMLAKDAQGELRHLDCSHIKLHQHGANPRGGQAAQAMGRTKGGLNTKQSAVVDRRGRAVALSLAPGPQHDQHAVRPVLPSVRRRRVVTDRGFDADVFRARLRAQRTRCCIPPASIAVITGATIRSKTSSAGSKVHRRISTRYDKLAETFLGFVCLAAILDWLTH
jgi:transposase